MVATLENVWKLQKCVRNFQTVQEYKICSLFSENDVNTNFFLKTWIQTMFTTSEQVRELLVFSWFGEMFRNYKSSQVQK